MQKSNPRQQKVVKYKNQNGKGPSEGAPRKYTKSSMDSWRVNVLYGKKIVTEKFRALGNHSEYRVVGKETVKDSKKMNISRAARPL